MKWLEPHNHYWYYYWMRWLKPQQMHCDSEVARPTLLLLVLLLDEVARATTNELLLGSGSSHIISIHIIIICNT